MNDMLIEISHLNVNAATKGAAAGGNLSQVPPLEKGAHTLYKTPPYTN